MDSNTLKVELLAMAKEFDALAREEKDINLAVVWDWRAKICREAVAHVIYPMNPVRIGLYQLMDEENVRS